MPLLPLYWTLTHIHQDRDKKENNIKYVKDKRIAHYPERHIRSVNTPTPTPPHTHTPTNTGQLQEDLRSGFSYDPYYLCPCQHHNISTAYIWRFSRQPLIKGTTTPGEGGQVAGFPYVADGRGDVMSLSHLILTFMLVIMVTPSQTPNPPTPWPFLQGLVTAANW